MDQEGLQAEADKTTPLFGAYRRGGYDPEQVDSYVADQGRRLEAAEHRASEAERRLAAAVGQLRELHRRVAVLESEDRSPQPPSLDTLGERVQRILKEAWEGAYALRQAAEQEVAELRDRATSEAEEIVGTAESRARQIDEEIERRRKAYLARLEEDRSRAVAQVSYLHDQRRVAVGELLRVKELIEATVGEAGTRVAPPPRRDAGAAAAMPAGVPAVTAARPPAAPTAEAADEARASEEHRYRAHPVGPTSDVPTAAVDDLGALVEEERRSSREHGETPPQRPARARPEAQHAGGRRSSPTVAVFDFEQGT